MIPIDYYRYTYYTMLRNGDAALSWVTGYRRSKMANVTNPEGDQARSWRRRWSSSPSHS